MWARALQSLALAPLDFCPLPSGQGVPQVRLCPHLCPSHLGLPAVPPAGLPTALPVSPQPLRWPSSGLAPRVKGLALLVQGSAPRVQDLAGTQALIFKSKKPQPQLPSLLHPPHHPRHPPLGQLNLPARATLDSGSLWSHGMWALPCPQMMSHPSSTWAVAMTVMVQT